MITTIITDFYELNIPHSDSGGIRDKDWCVCSRGKQGVFYLLNDGSLTLVNIIDLPAAETSKVYFNTEEKCHAAAGAYYLKHNVLYPHLDEWSLSKNGVSVAGSQVMEFI